MKKTKLALHDQWERFVTNPTYRNFTTDLYSSFYVSAGFIAHFNREGFYKARFMTKSDLDQTVAIMLRKDSLVAHLLNNTNATLLSAMYSRIIKNEIENTSKQVKTLNEALERLKVGSVI